MNDTNRRRYGFLPSRTHRLSANDLVGVIVILLFMGLVFHTLAPSVYSSPPKKIQQAYSVKQACDNTECWIVHYSNQYNVDSALSLRIAMCESSLDTYARNPNSSASGLYQFIEKTWDNYCEGNVFDEHANIQCFLQLYDRHPEWWQCS